MPLMWLFCRKAGGSVQVSPFQLSKLQRNTKQAIMGVVVSICVQLDASRNLNLHLEMCDMVVDLQINTCSEQWTILCQPCVCSDKKAPSCGPQYGGHKPLQQKGLAIVGQGGLVTRADRTL